MLKRFGRCKKELSHKKLARPASVLQRRKPDVMSNGVSFLEQVESKQRRLRLEILLIRRSQIHLQVVLGLPLHRVRLMAPKERLEQLSKRPLMQVTGMLLVGRLQ